jgi:hypothetical protein
MMTVYLMGEEVAEYNAYKASKGMSLRKRVIDTLLQSLDLLELQ